MRFVSVFCRRFSSSSCPAKKTALHELHERNGGKLVPFGGYSLPVHYEGASVSSSHVHTRSDASLFDVSHMLQTSVTGERCVEWIERLCPVDARSMPDGGAALTLFLNSEGGVLDDLIVTKVDARRLHVVSNASRREHDARHMAEHARDFAPLDVRFWDADERSLLALQGPNSQLHLQPLCAFDLARLSFMRSVETIVAGASCRVTRCGYTGEDGFEISMASKHATSVAEAILDNSSVKLAGLGARDSLRLEAGLCLYGSDVDETTTPVEAALAWLVPKGRRVASANFIGCEAVLKKLAEGAARKRVGLRVETGPAARHGAPVHDETGSVVGTVTSGCPSPTLGGAVAMAYVATPFSKLGTELTIRVRNTPVPAKVVKMPFVPTKYYQVK